MTTLFERKGDPVVDWKANQLQFKIIGPLAGHVAAEEVKDIAGGNNVAMS